MFRTSQGACHIASTGSRRKNLWWSKGFPSLGHTANALAGCPRGQVRLIYKGALVPPLPSPTPGSDSDPFCPTEESDPIARANSSASWELLPVLPNRPWASLREDGAHGERKKGATSPHVEISLEGIPELREGDGEVGETRSSSGGRLL